jgi:casein kinase 1 gamma
MLGVEILHRVEFLRSKGVLHCDLKPENLMMGRKGTNDYKTLHIVDFGLARFYIDPATNKHIAYDECQPLCGTLRYASIGSHLGIQSCRRDDLESLGFILIYWLRGTLPWSGLKGARSLEEHAKAVLKLKVVTTVEQLCEGFPRCAGMSSYLYQVPYIRFFYIALA